MSIYVEVGRWCKWSSMFSLDSLLQDLRYTVRSMRRSVGLTSVAIISLALGIGATVAIFSVIYALALRPLPVERPSELVEVLGVMGGNLHTYAEWKIFSERQHIFSSVLAYNHSDVNFQVSSPTRRQDVEGVYVSGSYFSTLGVPTILGRPLQVSDDQPGAQPVCVLGYGLWRQMYSQSRDVLGRTIEVNGNGFQIVGVAPSSFFGTEVGSIPEIFMPLEGQRTYRDYPLRYGHQTPSLDDAATIVSLAGRLKPGMSVSQANAGLQVLAAAIHDVLLSRPDGNKWQRTAPRTLSALQMANGTSDTWLQSMDMMVVLMAMAALVLIIACANLGNLLLARAAKRRNEISTRVALGASRSRLVRQLLTESATLSLASGAAGILLAHWGSQALLWALSYPDEPILLNLSWDAKLAAFAVSVTLACALLFGLVPALSATRISLSSGMNHGMAMGGPKSKLMNSALMVAQVALSLAVLVSAGLLVRTLHAFEIQDLGYDAKGVLVVHATWLGGGESPRRAARGGEEMLETFRSLAGVRTASWERASSSSQLSQLIVSAAGGIERGLSTYLMLVSSDFFTTRRATMVAGRDFNADDTETSPPVAILNANLAHSLFGKTNPVGLRFREDDHDGSGREDDVEVVGVVKDIQYRRPDYGPLPVLYRPVSQCRSACLEMGTFEIRVVGSLAQTAKRLEMAAGRVDPRVSLKFSPLSSVMDGVLHRNRAMALLATTFSFFVALLAMIGIYAMTSYAVAERTREIGVRIALGATRDDVLRMLLGEIMRPVLIGIAVGIAVVFPAFQLIRGAIWGVRPADPLSVGFAICSILVVAGLASFLPARHAMHIEPVVALRYE